MQRPLYLSGFMASGKSTVGRLVAERAGVEFLDLDECVSARAGKSVSDIFEQHGEDHFRALERSELERQLANPAPRVVALGGGALLRRELRLQALQHGVVVNLRTSPEETVRRSSAQGGRPLLRSPHPEDKIRELLEARATAYSEAHAQIDNVGSAEQTADLVMAVWRRSPIAVAAGLASYAVDVGSGIVAERLPPVLRGASAILLVSDSNVFRHHGELAQATARAACERVAVEVLPPGEEHKSLQTAELIWKRALEAGADRKSLVLAIGGGVVTDIAGFAAACWMRGIPWAGVPTTLLAQVDASVGGKTAVDLLAAKNAVGAFWQPKGVVCDVDLLNTEPQRGFVGALAEVVKSALIGDPELLTVLEEQAERVLSRDPEVVAEIVERSVRVKAAIVSRDERESGLRAVLNLGHTVGHALESCAGYTRLTHGEAISLGLVAALRIGERLGSTPGALTGRVIDLLRRLGLPVDVGAEPLDDAIALIGHDKKRAGSKVRFIVAKSEGQVEAIDVGLKELATHVLDLKAPAHA